MARFSWTSSQNFSWSLSFSLILGLLPLSAQAQQFLSSSSQSSCGGDIICGSVTVKDRDDRVAPEIVQPKATEKTIGACGRELPSGQDYQARVQGLSCGTVPDMVRPRLPMPVDQNKKDKADQYLASSIDELTKRTRAQDLLKTEIVWNHQFNVPVTEHWTYTSIVGDFNGPAESYQTICIMPRKEKYQVERKVYRDECTRWESIDDSPSAGSFGGGSYGGGSSGGSSSSRSSGSGSSNSDRMKGTSSGEIRNRSQDNYRSKKNGASLETAPIYRTIAESRRCVSTRRVYDHSEWDTDTRNLTPIIAPCTAMRGTWRTYPQTQQASRRCNDMKVNVKVEFKHDPKWTPADAKYLDLLPNKFDLLPGEREDLQLNLSTGQSLRPGISVRNAWNEYQAEVIPAEIRCDLGEKNFNLGIHTLGRIKRKAPNPFALPEDQKPMVGLDEKGRPRSLKLLDLARNLRLDQSMNSRRFESGVTGEESIGSSEAGGSKAFWVSTQFRMKLSKIDSLGRKFAVTLPNKFSTDQTDVFDNEMLISLGGKGGMDRLYRPAGPLEFIFGGLYHYLGVELSPNTDYELEVRAAQREFPFYESTCRNGEMACGSENEKESLFSEPILIRFKTEETSRSWLKWLKDKQIILF